MKSLLFLSIFTLVTIISANAQEQEGIIWSDSLNTAKNAKYLTDVEKNVIFEINKARSNPKAYANYLREQKKYYEGNFIVREGAATIKTEEGIAALNNCIAFLERATPVPLLKPNKDVSKASKRHAKDCLKNSVTDHKGSDGSTPADRMKKENASITVKESLCFGRTNAVDIVKQLLIDDGVKSRDNRKSIMSPKTSVCGVSYGKHPRLKTVCVINCGVYNP